MRPTLVWMRIPSPLVRKWQGSGWQDIPVCDMDIRAAATTWQWRSREDGKQFGFFGTFTEVNGPSKIVHEQYFDAGDIGGPGEAGAAMPAGDPCIVSLELSEQNGVTTLVCNLTFASKDARDGAVSTGMTDGMEYSYARLDDMFTAAA